MAKRRYTMTYQQAIRWLAENDDCSWITDGPLDPPSVAAAAVADIFDRAEIELRADLTRELKHLYPATYATLEVA